MMQTQTVKKTVFHDLSLILLTGFAISLSGCISIPLWFTPVPLITQNMAVLLAGAFLGPKRGALAVLFFLFQGLMGLPVFSSGTTFGFARLLGPTGGYLIGFLVAAYFVGWWFQKRKSTTFQRGLGLVLGSFLIYLFGATHLASFVGIEKAVTLGILPFLFLDVLKIICSLRIIERVVKGRL